MHGITIVGTWSLNRGGLWIQVVTRAGFTVLRMHSVAGKASSKSHFGPLLQVPYAAFLPSHLLCTFTVARATALVVDVGAKETTILPVSSIALALYTHAGRMRRSTWDRLC